MYSRVPNNRRGWNNTGWGGREGLDIIIIINNKGIGIIGGGGVGRGSKNSAGGFSVLIC